MQGFKAHQLKTAGWYWWRLSVNDEWRIDHFDPVKDAAALKIAGGSYYGPVQPPSPAKIAAIRVDAAAN